MTLAELIVYSIVVPLIVGYGAATAVFIFVVLPIMLVRRLVRGPELDFDYEGA